MISINQLLAALDEREIARTVGLAQDEARMSFPLRHNTVASFEEFSTILGEYYNHHFSRCLARGARLSPIEASGRAKELIEREYHRHQGTIVTAYNEAQDGTNGGLRALLDIIADGLKSQAVERYVRYVFDHMVSPNSWEDKVELIRQFINYCGNTLGSAIRADQPERYAQNAQELINSYVQALRHTSSKFRSL